MFAHPSDTKLVCAVLIEIYCMRFIRYDQFGRVLPIPDHQDGDASFQIKLVVVLLEHYSTVNTGLNFVGFGCLV